MTSARTIGTTALPAAVPPRAVLSGVVGMVLVGSSVGVSATLTAAPLFLAQAMRYAAAGVILLAVARFRGIRIARPRGADWAWLAGIAATGLVLFNVAVVRGDGVAQPAMIAVAVSCAPILLAVVGPLLQRQVPQRRLVAAAAVVTVGAVLVEGAGRASATGIGWAVLALGCEAAFTLLAVPVLDRLGAWGVSVYSVCLGAAMFAALAGVTERPSAALRLTQADLAAVGYLAVLVTVVAFILWYSCVAGLGPAKVGLLTGIAPVSAALTGMVTAHREPNALMWTGIAVVLAALVAGLRPRRAATTSAIATRDDEQP